MPNKKLLIRKLRHIAVELKHLERLANLSAKELFGKAQNYYFAERVMERLINAAIDINMHLITDLDFEMTEDYFTSFIRLGEHEIIPMRLAKRIAPSTSLRNILVHEYEKVNPEKFKKSLRSALKDYAEYSKYIAEFI